MPRPSRLNDVVEAAANVFKERGYHATRLEDIAEALGMQKGSLYNYISSKEELLLAVVRPPAGRLLSSLSELAEADLPATEKIRLVAKSHAGVLEEYFPYVAVYVQEIAGQGHSEEWLEMDRRYVRLLSQIIDEGRTSGLFGPSTNPTLSAMALIGSLNWMTRWYEQGGQLSAEELADQIASTFLGGLITRTGRR
ncbi:MAG: TetR/AcrR family transcriptional regulator [Ilumatobacter sp.]|jgi:TetR/AcrR family transcriptional regulator, cholesterol catabolism regulator|uniref:TetR/AcrR family transcriptional regulator n=1 Tax=Ilumatobacter sp. TaxID=1967498 RepID=UPI003919AAD1